MTKLLKRIRGPLIIVVILVLLITVGLIRRQKPAQELLPTIPLVESATLAELEQTATTNHTSLVRSATSAPLITRNGGRVAHVNFNLGDTVNAGTIIAEIDNAAAGNPIVSQIAGLKKSLSILNNLLNITSTASNHAINSAELNLKSSQDNKPLTQEQANIARRQADNSRVQAEFGLEDANELGDDDLVRAANLALNAAEFAQDQATASRALTRQQTKFQVDQAETNLNIARTNRHQALAQLELQKSQLETQHQVAQAQFQQQQITAPLNGQLVSLKVKTGDFLQPGQQIGEIRASEGAYIELELNPNQKAALNIGQILNITSPGQSFTGQVTNLAQLPSSQTEHYQAEISITNTTFPIHPGDLVEVQLPLSTSRSDTHLVPLDALLVRESGPVLISIQDDNTILENPVQIINYSQSFVEILTNLSKSMRVALSGHRLLTSGDQINY